MTDLLKLFEELDDDSGDYDSKRTYKRCPLNYMGSKRETLDAILALLPYSNTWVDVFGGSGIVTFSRRPSKLDVFNDRHGGICAFYRALKERPDELIAQIELMPHSREFFDWAKATEVQDVDDVMRGAKWYYMIQASFAGRADAWGRVTNGRNNIIDKLYRTLEIFPTIHQRLKFVQIENLDWQQIFVDYDGYDVIFYCDPPYVGSNKYRFSMSDYDHHTLCKSIMQLKGFCALSGFNNSIYNSYDWDGKHVFEVRNNVSTVAYGGDPRSKKRLECLWIKEVS